MELTPEQVNDFISKAILDSNIGQIVKESVARVIAELSKTYNNPFDGAIKREVYSIIEKEIQNQYRPQLEEGVKKAMANWATDEVMNRIINSAMERLEGKY